MLVSVCFHKSYYLIMVVATRGYDGRPCHRKRSEFNETCMVRELLVTRISTWARVHFFHVRFRFSSTLCLTLTSEYNRIPSY